MNLVECLELSKKYSHCPRCGNDRIGGGEGSLIIEDMTFKRGCKCGWKVHVESKEVKDVGRT
ncbi:DUF3797 domain-containing protein [Carnobacterium divergens]|uniref:DUF3797 domain-containing protein n=1 Tax=Carnobacterium divergens TaxID=2748 RepID=UPI001073FFFE|nr:DUF3797 domain-containing protein [Carnobacterium divergens]TFI86925.1 DUF3797 domain-containing protein [Carnobacterium divergens]